MKKYVKTLLVTAPLILYVSVLIAQEKSDTPETLIKFETTQGNMVVKLYNETPGHRDNMIKLINDGFFDGQLFHRVISGFMIQGGDPHSVGAAKGQRVGTGGPGYTLAAEFHEGHFHKKGALAAARQGDQANPEKRSSGSQFYLIQGKVFTPEQLNLMARQGMGPFSNEAVEVYTTVGGSPHLDGDYTVFGEVVEGLEVIDRIASLQTDSYNRPVEDVIFSMALVK